MRLKPELVEERRARKEEEEEEKRSYWRYTQDACDGAGL